MKDHNPHDPLNMIGEAYEQFLEKTMHNLHIHDGKNTCAPTHSRHKLDSSKSASKQLHPLISEKELVKMLLLNLLQHTADKTTIDLSQFQQHKRLPEEFHVGDLVNTETLYCEHCGYPKKFELPSFLNECKNCGHTTFIKQH